MQNPAATRKRPAPSTSQMMQQPLPQPQYQYQQMPDNTDYNNFDFSNPLPPDQTYSDPSSVYNNNLSYDLNASHQPAYSSNLAPQPSTELVRRARNQQLASQSEQQEAWNGYGNMGGQVEDEDERDLDAKVAIAKKDAQGKRKQIPPFVQKLSSFLDNNNTELIRWSDDGRSFIVLDEDEFARTLIPELFKHSNYASFVRQLNMYGFHKTVNITDGSLRQSEKARKGVKPPSMYSHPYFRKNRPDLLWLIQKPTTKSSVKRKRDGTVKDQYDSDDDQYSPQPEGRPHQLSAPNTSNDVAQLPRNELNAVRQELQKLQTQQRLISQMIAQLKEQNDQFYRQATAFQTLHDRHENSINAILTFLATFYNRSLEGHGNQNLVNMFTNVQNQQHGSVVEEYNDPTPTPDTQLQRFVKRPPLLLPGPTSNTHNLKPGSAMTQPNSARASASPPNDGSKRGSTSNAPPDSARFKEEHAASPVVKTEPETPSALSMPENNDQMMNLINSVNATQASTPNASAPAIDFSSIVDQYGNQFGNPLTPQQRDNTLADMLRQSGGDTSNMNNALAAPAAPNLDLNKLKSVNDQLEKLQNLQKSQAEQLQELTQKVTPMSPSGTIPGVLDHSQDPFDSIGAPGDYDPNAFINFGDGDWDPANAGDNADFDFGFDTSGNGNMNWSTNYDNGTDTDDLFGTNDNAMNDRLAPRSAADGGGRVESVSSEATSPAATVLDVGEEPGTPNKRQRRQ